MESGDLVEVGLLFVELVLHFYLEKLIFHDNLLVDPLEIVVEIFKLFKLDVLVL